MQYRVTHNKWDFNDDLKFVKSKDWIWTLALTEIVLYVKSSKYPLDLSLVKNYNCHNLDFLDLHEFWIYSFSVPVTYVDLFCYENWMKFSHLTLFKIKIKQTFLIVTQMEVKTLPLWIRHSTFIFKCLRISLYPLKLFKCEDPKI